MIIANHSIAAFDVAKDFNLTSSYSEVTIIQKQMKYLVNENKNMMILFVEKNLCNSYFMSRIKNGRIIEKIKQSRHRNLQNY